MIWERLLLRLVPAFLVVTGVLVAVFVNTTHSGILGLSAIALSVLMAVALVFYELEIRRSEDRLRERADSSAESDSSTSRPITRRSQPSHDKPDFDNVSVKDLSMRSLDMTGASFAGASLRQCDFSSTQLSHANFTSALLANNRFEGANLRSAQMDTSEIRDCKFENADLDSSNWPRALITDSAFRNADLTRAQFTEAQITQCSFDGAVAEDTSFSRASLANCAVDGVVFDNADFTQAAFVATPIVNVDFSTAVIKETSIDPQSLGHKPLITMLLELIAQSKQTVFVLIDSDAGFVQAFREGESIRCEAVNFDSWPGWRDSRKMTPDMSRKLEELGLKPVEGDNFVCFVEPPNFDHLETMAERLGTVLHDVYGVSTDAALKVSVGRSAQDESEKPTDEQARNS